MLIPVLRLDDDGDRRQVELILQRLRLDPVDLALLRGDRARQTAAVQEIFDDVARRGDQAIVEISKKFDDPGFSQEQIRVRPEEMAEATEKVSPEQLSALRRSIDQVRQYQTHIMPQPPPPLRRAGVELNLRFIPLDSVGIYFPGGKAAYPSSLVMQAVPAQVAGVKKIVVCTPPSRFSRCDLVLAACYELKLEYVYRAGGAAAIAAMAFGTRTIPAVDKIVGPGNVYVQLAKRLLAGCVGIDGFLGPSEIVVIADETGNPAFIAADLLAQAEHDPGRCFLLTTSQEMADEVVRQLQQQMQSLNRRSAIEKALREDSAIVIHPSMQELIRLANRLAAEHVSIQTRDDQAVLAELTNAGAVFCGPYSPVAAGDYVAGPSHCLPTNTTARFSSGISVYEFLKRVSVERYTEQGLKNDANAIIELASAEQLDAHAASVKVRTKM